MMGMPLALFSGSPKRVSLGILYNVAMAKSVASLLVYRYYSVCSQHDHTRRGSLVAPSSKLSLLV